MRAKEHVQTLRHLRLAEARHALHQQAGHGAQVAGALIPGGHHCVAHLAGAPEVGVLLEGLLQQLHDRMQVEYGMVV